MADRLDAVNASFEDCEEQDDDVEIMQTEETAPILLYIIVSDKSSSIEYKSLRIDFASLYNVPVFPRTSFRVASNSLFLFL